MGEVNPVRNSSGALNPAGIILEFNPTAEQRGIISNGVKEYVDKILELSERIMALGESIRRIEKDMEPTWMDQVYKRNLRDLKNYLKQEEDLHCMLQEEVSHI